MDWDSASIVYKAARTHLTSSFLRTSLVHMKLRLKDEELRAYSGEHLLHELSMFWELAHILSEREQGTTEYVALIESFAIIFGT